MECASYLIIIYLFLYSYMTVFNLIKFYWYDNYGPTV